MANFNLKTIFSADTQPLKDGAKEAKEAVKDFDDASESALDHVVGLFGTSMGDVGKSLSAIKGGLLSVSNGMKASIGTATGMTKALKVLKVAMAATGIGLLVTALASLVAYFSQSQSGSEKLSILMGQLGQIVKTITDYFIKMGGAIVRAFTDPVAAVKNLWNAIKNPKEFFSNMKAVGQDILDRQKKNLELTRRRQQLEWDTARFQVEEAKLEAENKKQQLIVADKLNYTAAQRLAASKKSEELITELYNKRKHFAQEAYDLKVLENSLSESTLSDLTEQWSLESEITKVAGDMAGALKEIKSQQVEITNQVLKEQQAREKIAALRARGPLARVDGSGIDSNQPVAALNKPEVVFEETPSMKYAKREKEFWDQQKEEMEKDLVDLGRIATEFSKGVADAFSSMVQGLVSGNLSLRDIFGGLLEFLGATLKQIGEALIAYGVAMDAFKKTFSNPWAAIAAGAALVAAGTVLTNLVNKASSASGAASVSSGYAAATVGGGGTLNLTGATSYSGSVKEIKVTGTLKAAGNQLVAVIENENKRKMLTT